MSQRHSNPILFTRVVQNRKKEMKDFGAKMLHNWEYFTIK